ncbi:MAG TPA: TetR/AcrR family transcriptional regulator [Candidatus Limnocylindrales bacterium]|nr:TetR/AcrR family transcriptional regulator [Candidatus Limnocylindrales bacterium]
MARTVNPAAHALRRDEFVDVALRLIQTRGYEQLSIGDVLGELGASKGAFYHYFDSKQSLLEAVVERITDTVDALVQPIVDDPALPALDKLQLFFSTVVRWKSERKDLLIGLLETWQSDDNAIVREKVLRSSVRRITPLIARIVRQGMESGDFALAHPDALAQVIVALVLEFGQANADLFLAYHAGEVDRDTVERTVATYSLSVERILGVTPGSLTLMDAEAVRVWFA